MPDSYSVMLWISVSILPQMALVSYFLSHINYLVGRLKQICTLYIFQEFITLWTSRGFKETITVIWQFPAIILTPAFSFWVIGPIGKLKCTAERSYTVETSTEIETCWGKSKKIGISYLHTWINIGLTLSSEFWLVYLWHSGSSSQCPSLWHLAQLHLKFLYSVDLLRGSLVGWLFEEFPWISLNFNVPKLS